jgi:hypothetical protein
MEQSPVINQMVKKLLHPGKSEMKLDDGFKEQLQKQIDSKLDQPPKED